jgi:hypothetical protein
MKQIVVLSLGVILSGVTANAQTNVPSATVSPFVLPPIQLWEPPAAQEQSQTLGFAVPASPQFSGSGQHVALDTLSGDNEFHSRLLRSGQFYLTAPEPESENRFVRAAEALWTPEVVKVGKTSISSPIITAVKRKNPLCLLNPLFFQASW